jgi:hypothetical protein
LNDELLKKRVKWEQWTVVNKQVVLQEVGGTVGDTLDALFKLLPQFLKHTFIKKQQANFLKSERSHLILRPLLCK